MMMASSSANVEAPPRAGVQLTEGPLAAEVPAGGHPGAVSSRAASAGDTNAASAGDTNGAAAGDTNAASAEDTNGAAAGDTNGAAAGDTNGAAAALCELLAVKLGIGGGTCWPPAIHALIPWIKVGTMAVIVAPSCCCTCSWTISGIRATCALSS